jgi:hypothetical protein
MYLTHIPGEQHGARERALSGLRTTASWPRNSGNEINEEARADPLDMAPGNTSSLSVLANRGKVFVVVRQLPETDGMFEYQIKSEMDGHVRVAREPQLTDL